MDGHVAAVPVVRTGIFYFSRLFQIGSCARRFDRHSLSCTASSTEVSLRTVKSQPASRLFVVAPE